MASSPALLLTLCVAFALCGRVAVASLPPCQCPAESLLESLRIRTADSCKSASFVCEACSFEANSTFANHVVEVNEFSLNRLLDRLRNKGAHRLARPYLEDSNLAVLYYAEWCPFSKQLFPVFEELSKLHQNILHVAVAEHNIRPSLMSRFGVSSVPVLFLHNNTHRMKYTGVRSLEAISEFYSDFIGEKNDVLNWGLECSPAHWELMEIISQTRSEEEGCPYSWAFHPEIWFGKRPLLILSFSFLFIRLLISVAAK